MPKRRLTESFVERVKPPAKGKQAYHFDEGWPGLALRVSYGGQKSWAFFYWIGRRQRLVTLGTYPGMTLPKAREAWRKGRVDLADGIDPAPKRAAAEPMMAFEAVIAEWLKREQGENRSLYQVTRLVEHDLLPKWTGRRIDTIRKRDVIELIDGITDRGTPVKARNVWAALNPFFKWCVERDILEASPMAALKRPKAKDSRERFLSDGELVDVWRGTEAVDPGGLNPYSVVVRLLILTGARKEEIGQLKWSELQGDAIHLEGSRTKNGHPHLIPLSTSARNLLAAVIPVAGCEFVFTVDGKKPITGWSKAKEKLDAACGVKDWRIHDLRRTIATGMQKLGVQLQVVETILGHTGGSRSGIVGIYQKHNFIDERRAALEAWSAKVQDLVAGRETGKVLAFGAR